MHTQSTALTQDILQTVPRGTVDRLKTYEAMLKEWQSRMNLVSKNTLDQAWARHFEDSLQLLPFAPEGAKTLFDIGSGAGFPGLVFGICRPDIKVHLIESTGKKCGFLNAVAQEVQAENVTVHNGRIEDSSKGALKSVVPDIVSARALAALDKLFVYCEGWAKANPDLMLVFPKGRKAQEEVEAARTGWVFDVETHTSCTDAEASVLIIRNLKRCA